MESQYYTTVYSFVQSFSKLLLTQHLNTDQKGLRRTTRVVYKDVVVSKLLLRGGRKVLLSVIHQEKVDP